MNVHQSLSSADPGNRSGNAISTDKTVLRYAGRAGSLLKAGRAQDAIEYCREGLDRFPGQPELLWLLADAFMISNQYRHAIDIYQTLAAFQPTNTTVHELLAAAHTRTGNIETGRQLLRAHFRDNPKTIRQKGRTGDPTILRISGLEQTYVTSARNRLRRPRPSYRGGHFSTRYLLTDIRNRLIKWTIADDNINWRNDVPNPSLILNTIAEPDVERQSLQSLVRYLDANPDIPVINHPARVLETTRDVNFRRFGEGSGIEIPRTLRLVKAGRDSQSLADEIETSGFGYPLILRETGTHTARSVLLAENADQAEQYFVQSPADAFYAIAFRDTRLDGKHFNKKRFFCIDGTLYPVVSHIDRVWNVHGSNRRTVMANEKWMQDQEILFLNDPEAEIGSTHYKTLQRLHAVVGLDFFGMDFTIDANDRLVVFELNASMRHSFDHARNFPYMRPHMERISDAFTEMVRRRAA